MVLWWLVHAHPVYRGEQHKDKVKVRVRRYAYGSLVIIIFTI